MKVDISYYLKNSYQLYLKMQKISEQYIMLNLSSIINYHWYKVQLEEIMHTHIIEIYEYQSNIRDIDNINLAYTIKTDIYRNKFPFIYFVDIFVSLENNQFWKKLREKNIKKDLVVDRHGTICFLTDLLNCIYK